MMQRWGYTHVSSALEVYLVLANPPPDPHGRRLWQGLLAVEPPIWGHASARRCALTLAARGLRVWSWDERGVVFSDFDARPPRSLRYCPWYRLLLGPGRFSQESSEPC
jgi:hypothetical protein